MALTEPRVSRGLAVADFDNDGNMDVIIEDLDGAPMLLRNAGVLGMHWVSFELSGAKKQSTGDRDEDQDCRGRGDANGGSAKRRRIYFAARSACAFWAGFSGQG